MSLMGRHPDDIGNAEGYCKKCGHALGIDGRCATCDIDWEALEAAVAKLPSRRGFHCPKCGLPMYHSRLYGYRCRIEEHNDK